jgi:hypothetical protein
MIYERSAIIDRGLPHGAAGCDVGIEDVQHTDRLGPSHPLCTTYVHMYILVPSRSHMLGAWIAHRGVALVPPI